MNDKKILEEVYRRLQDYSSSFRREGHLGVNRYDIKDFIEQEWQKADEGQEYKMHSVDVAEIERHRGLEIDSDGTVTELK